MKKLISILSAAAMLLLGGCGVMNAADEVQSGQETETSEPDTQPSETETEPVKEDVSEAEIHIPDNQFMADIVLGMNREQVIEVMGEPENEADNYKVDFTTHELQYSVEFYDVENYDDALVSGYKFFEFSENDSLICYGWHLGPVGEGDGQKFPYSENDLGANFKLVMLDLEEKYGAGEYSDEYADYGVREEYTWHTSGGDIWAAWGVDMWGGGEPASYEDGINEIIVSCSVPAEEQPQEQQEPDESHEQQNYTVELMDGIKLGMSRSDVEAIVGAPDNEEEYMKSELVVETAYNSIPYPLEAVQLKGYMFFEYSTDEELICYGWHLGKPDGYSSAYYPYTEDELSQAYSLIYNDLSEKYGRGEHDSYSGIKDEYSWITGNEVLWAVWGTNMWSDQREREPEEYEAGINEIIISCSEIYR